MAVQGEVIASYAGAVDHYLSAARYDAVKLQWEEPASRALLQRALDALDPQGPLRVLDVGCGAGDGLALLRSTPGSRQRILAPGGLRYTGLDIFRTERPAESTEITCQRGVELRALIGAAAAGAAGRNAARCCSRCLRTGCAAWQRACSVALASDIR
ncbi:MAG: hypothetical protein ACRDRL_32560 [Sciscionella sp.]